LDRSNLFRKQAIPLPLGIDLQNLASKLRIGCSGWGYDDWVGPFYPPGTRRSEYLRLYSRTFETVEVDSSFYHFPTPATCVSWFRSTPEGFLFTAKMPKEITHEKKLAGVDSQLERVYMSMSELKEKLAVLVVQLPPSVTFEKHSEVVKRFIGNLDLRFRHAIEFRHQSWFREDVSSLLRGANIAAVWSQSQYLSTPPAITADFAYVRLVGERDIVKFDRIVKDRSSEMAMWRDRLESSSGDIGLAFVILNNHFAGFSPSSVNHFRKAVGLNEAVFPVARSQQRSISEFQ